MIGKPFRPPLLRKVEDLGKPPLDGDSDEPQPKKRRIDDVNEENVEQSRPQLIFKRPGISSLPRKPLLAVNNPPIVTQPTHPANEGVDCCYNVLW